MTEDLRIDTGLVLEAGEKLNTIAGAIPEPPTVFSPTGADALSTAIAGKIAEVVDPVIAQMPEVKAALARYAQNVIDAAQAYDSTDRQLAEEILRRVEAFDKAAGGGSPGGAPGAGSTPTGTASPAVGAAAPASGAAEQAGQMGQMAQMPMQLAQQAAQIPMQMASMAAAIPQAMMQGVQSAVQAASQASEMTGEDELQTEGEPAKLAEEIEKPPEDAGPTPQEDAAAPGATGGERAPEPKQQEPQPPAAPKPAPTRPAESAPEIAL